MDAIGGAAGGASSGAGSGGAKYKVGDSVVIKNSPHTDFNEYEAEVKEVLAVKEGSGDKPSYKVECGDDTIEVKEEHLEENPAKKKVPKDMSTLST